MPRSSRSAAVGLTALLAGTLVAGCGLNVSSPDLFLLKRTGEGRKLTLLVNDGGTIRCNGGPAKNLPDPLLLSARDLATALDQDAKNKLRMPPNPRSVFDYTVRLQDGTISFQDTAAATHKEFADAEQFVLQASQGPCGLSG
jgi:hypothetical protein